MRPVAIIKLKLKQRCKKKDADNPDKKNNIEKTDEDKMKL